MTPKYRSKLSEVPSEADRLVARHSTRLVAAEVPAGLKKRYGKPTTAAMAVGIAEYPWSYTQIAQLLD